MSEENKQLRWELDMVKGLCIRMEAENTELRNKVTQLSARAMKDNLIISGLCNDESLENPLETVTEFLEETMQLEFTRSELVSARRIGRPAKPDVSRAMLIEVKTALREMILNNKKVLKGVKNSKKERIQDHETAT